VYDFSLIDFDRRHFFEMSFEDNALVRLVLIPADEPIAKAEVVMAESKPYFFMQFAQCCVCVGFTPFDSSGRKSLLRPVGVSNEQNLRSTPNRHVDSSCLRSKHIPIAECSSVSDPEGYAAEKIHSMTADNLCLR
jgi:hypothetical protein